MILATILLLCFGCIAIIGIIKLLYDFKKLKKTIDLIPGPTDSYYPIIGNVLAYIRPTEELFAFLRLLARKYYPIYKAWHFHQPLVSILCPEDMEIAISTTRHITKGAIYDCLKPWLGTGLLTSTGRKWQHRRKILTPSFHFNILQQFMKVFAEESERFIKQLQEECKKPSTNITPLISDFTLNTVCETAMGIRLEKTDAKSVRYRKAIYRLGEIVLHRLLYPWNTINAIFMMTTRYYEQKRLLKILHGFSSSVIKERSLNFKEPDFSNLDEDIGISKKKRLAMLDLLISAKLSGESINDHGIREEVDTFTFEGHDTTSSCICFTLFALANNKDIQDKVVQELQEIFGDSSHSATLQDLQNLQYLELVIKESLRMYPPVPFISRITDEDMKTHSGYLVPAGTILELHIYDLHHNPDIYPEPEKFDPERFTPENSNRRHPFAYVPFSAGPRNCIGQKFAMLEIKTIISAILRNFIVEPVDKPSDLTFICHFVLKTMDGVRVKFRPRNK